MNNHNIIIAVRNITKYWKYSLINISGLAIGIACVIFIVLYISDELKYDKFNAKAERIYRVNRLYNSNNVNEDAATMEFPCAPALEFDYPDLVERAVRFFNFMRDDIFIEYTKANNEVVRFNDKGFFLVDSTIFDVFSFPFLEGDPRTALDRPNTIVITESTAKRYFGDESPIGKTLRIEEGVNFEVTGVIKDIPSQSHFKINFLASLTTFRVLAGGRLPQTWIWNPCWTYVLLRPGITQQMLDAKFPQFYKNHYDDLKDQDVKIYLQPLTDIHLESHHVYEMHQNSNSIYIYILSIIAAIVLLMACINFMNLVTAKSAGRAKEIGVKKVFGGNRGQLTRQFLGEAIFQTFIGLIFAVVLVELLLPGFNSFTGKSIGEGALFQLKSIAYLIFLGLFVGVLAGAYPAFFLSSFQPLAVLKGTLSAGSRSSVARKVLVVIQFTISISLIIGTLVVFSQLNFLRNAELGFKKDHIITVQRTGQMFQNYEAFKQELLKNKDIQYVTGAEDVLGVNHNTRAYEVEGLTAVGQNFYIPTFMVDWDFLETFGIKVVSGRGFDRRFPSDTVNAVMINEHMAKDLGWTNESAIGRKVKSQDGDERVIGVFRDFNAMSLHRPVNNFILDMFRRPAVFARIIAIRVNSNNYPEVIKYIEEKWKQFNPTRPFEYRFLDSQLQALYSDEDRFGKFSLMLTLLAIMIASLGLIGLTLFLAEQRTREIGIRRVLGATTMNIVKLLFGEFTLLLLVSNVIAWPITYLITTRWLETYSRHIPTQWGLYAVATIFTLLLALFVTGYQAIRTAHLNPAKTLKYE